MESIQRWYGVRGVRVTHRMGFSPLLGFTRVGAVRVVSGQGDQHG